MTSIEQAKQALRERTWRRLIDSGVAAPDAWGRIPAFTGAAATASRLADLDGWRHAKTVMANPDRAQLPVRARALREGKLLYMAVPAMADAKPFYRLDPERLDSPVEAAADPSASARVAERVAIEEMRPIDVVVCGSVAVNRDGARLGKGAGYSDLEVALLIEAGHITDATVIIAPVHRSQLLDEAIPEAAHDVRVDYVVTPDEVIRCAAPRRPTGIDWNSLKAEQLAAIPVLADRAPPRRPA